MLLASLVYRYYVVEEPLPNVTQPCVLKGTWPIQTLLYGYLEKKTMTFISVSDGSLLTVTLVFTTIDLCGRAKLATAARQQQHR